MGDEWDEVLDQGLASYSAAEPLSGLEDRVLARVRGTGVRRAQPWFWGWVAACLVLLCLGWLGLRREQPVVAPVRIQAARAAAPKQVFQQLRVTRRVRKRPAPARPRLSQEEILLVRLVTADPEGTLREFASLNESVNREITAEPLVVEPIKAESLEGEKE